MDKDKKTNKEGNIEFVYYFLLVVVTLLLIIGGIGIFFMIKQAI